jgi:hypothetical protein
MSEVEICCVNYDVVVRGPSPSWPFKEQSKGGNIRISRITLSVWYGAT